MIEKSLKHSVYILLMFVVVFIIIYVISKIINDRNNIENFKQLDMEKRGGFNRGCVGSIYVPFVRKCPKFLPYEWSPSNNMAHGLCCNNYPKPEGPILDKNLYDCVQGHLRSRCTGCLANEYDTGELPNDHPGICCKKVRRKRGKRMKRR